MLLVSHGRVQKLVLGTAIHLFYSIVLYSTLCNKYCIVTNTVFDRVTDHDREEDHCFGAFPIQKCQNDPSITPPKLGAFGPKRYQKIENSENRKSWKFEWVPIIVCGKIWANSCWNFENRQFVCKMPIFDRHTNVQSIIITQKEAITYSDL